MTKEKLPHSDDGSFDYMLLNNGLVKEIEPIKQIFKPLKLTPKVSERMHSAFVAEYSDKTGK
ncbi:hypothetical protein HYU93_02575 [Candidatus Daviesbacteria bacterium]|nr:hypothetical protein [Candidatus Daviesbacteria bacterium]